MAEARKRRGAPKGLRWTAGTLWRISQESRDSKDDLPALAKKFAKKVELDALETVLEDGRRLDEAAFMAKYRKKPSARGRNRGAQSVSEWLATGKVLLGELHIRKEQLEAELELVNEQIRTLEALAR